MTWAPKPGDVVAVRCAIANVSHGGFGVDVTNDGWEMSDPCEGGIHHYGIPMGLDIPNTGPDRGPDHSQLAQWTPQPLREALDALYEAAAKYMPCICDPESLPELDPMDPWALEKMIRRPTHPERCPRAALHAVDEARKL